MIILQPHDPKGTSSITESKWKGRPKIKGGVRGARRREGLTRKLFKVCHDQRLGSIDRRLGGIKD